MNTKICIIGATGNVGRKVTAMLLERNLFNPEDIVLFASHRSHGTSLMVQKHEFIVQDIEYADFSQFKLCVFNTESDISERFIPKALQAQSYVIDSSSRYRLDPEVPLIIPPVNKNLINLKNKLYAHANCLASPIATVLSPIHNYNKIKRINVVTYQATSGAGKVALDECFLESSSIINSTDYKRVHFERQIAFNVIPQVGEIREDGMTYEEYKIIHEIKKVVDNNIAISATAVRVPVMIGHSIALNIEFYDKYELEDIYHILKNAPCVTFENNRYKTPVEVVGTDDVHVGRIRRDNSLEFGLQLWLCSDNLRRGAATDSVEIVENLKKLIS